METTYTFHFQFSEEMASHNHTQRDGENENEGKCERYRTGLHNPQQCKAQYLDGCKQVHSSCAHLCSRNTDILLLIILIFVMDVDFKLGLSLICLDIKIKFKFQEETWNTSHVRFIYFFNHK